LKGIDVFVFGQAVIRAKGWSADDLPIGVDGQTPRQLALGQRQLEDGLLTPV